MNPYYGKSFFGFFGTLFKRGYALLNGESLSLTTDEVQLFVLMMIALSASLIGTFLVLKKMTMLANSLSHTILLGIVGAYLILGGGSVYSPSLSPLLVGAVLTALITTFSTEFLHKTLRLQEDTSIGMIFTGFFALGVLLVTTLSRNSHLGVEAIMGNADALHPKDLKQVLLLLLMNGTLLLLFYRRLELLTFDSEFARNMGISLGFFNYLLMFQTAITAIGSFRAVGTFLFLAFLVAPALTARFFTDKLRQLLLIAGGIGVLAACVAVALSRHILTSFHLPLSTAGLTASILGLFFLLGALKKRAFG